MYSHSRRGGELAVESLKERERWLPSHSRRERELAVESLRREREGEVVT